MQRNNELESLLRAIGYHMDGDAESKKFAKQCIEKCLMLVEESQMETEQKLSKLEALRLLVVDKCRMDSETFREIHDEFAELIHEFAP